MYGESDKERCIREVDSAVEVIQALSPLVDDLASDLPAPLDIPATIKQVRRSFNTNDPLKNGHYKVSYKGVRDTVPGPNNYILPSL